MTRQDEPSRGQRLLSLAGIASVVLSVAVIIDVLYHGPANRPQTPDKITPTPQHSGRDLTIAGRTIAEWREVMSSLDLSNDQSRQYVPGLRQLIMQDEVPDVTRSQAALTLGRLRERGAEAVPDLIHLMHLSPGNSARRWAVKALGLMGPPADPAIPPLIERIRDRGASLIERLHALEAVSQIGGPEAIEAIVSLLPDRVPLGPGDERELQIEAAVSLGYTRFSEGLSIPRLLANCEQPDPRMRRAILDTFTRYGPAAATAAPAIIDRMLLDDDLAVRDAAEKALTAIGPNSFDPTSILEDSRPTDPDPLIRCIRVVGGWGRGGTRWVPNLLPQIHSSDPQIRRTACRAIWMIRGSADQIDQVLANDLLDDNHEVRRLAYNECLAIGKSMIPALEKVARTPNENARLARKLIEKLSKPTDSW